MSFDPLDIDGLTYSGLEWRRAALLGVMSDGTALGARSGIRPGDPGLAVTLASSTVNVSAGVAWVYQSGQGVYRAALPASASPGTLTAAHATLTRVDLVYLRVWDNAVDASGLTKADVVLLTGTPAGSPVAPTPAGTQIYIPLATITVPPVGGGAAAVNSSVRPVSVAPGGILPSTSSPASPYTGQYWDDGTFLRRWNGSTWRVVSAISPTVVNQVSMPGSFSTGAFTDFPSGNWGTATVTVPQSGMVKVSIAAAVANTVSGTATAWCGWRASGTTTLAASEINSVATVGARTYAGRSYVLTGMTPGTSLVITPQYQFSAVGTIGAVTRCSDGQLVVEPMPG